MTSTVTGPPVFGFFMIPMTQAMGIGRGTFTLAFSIRAITAGLSGPIIGPLVDRHGPRTLMFLGSLLSGLVVMGLGGVQAFWQFAFAFAVLGFTVTAGMGRIVSLVTVARWFVRKRGRALAFATSGFSVGVAVFAPLSQGLITIVGWRLSWVILGACIWLVMIPASLAFMRKSPEAMGLKPDGDAPKQSHLSSVPEADSPSGDVSWTFGMAVRTRSLWLLQVSFVLTAAAIPAVTIHQVPAILDKGFGVVVAAAAVFIFGITGIVSKIIFGFLVERISIQFVTIGCLLGSGASLFLLVIANSIPMIYAYSFTYGLLRGAIPTLESIIWADYFGRDFLGTIRGVLQPFTVIAGASGPLLAGLLFDLTLSYTAALTTFIAMYLISASVLVFAPPPSHPQLQEQVI